MYEVAKIIRIRMS